MELGFLNSVFEAFNVMVYLQDRCIRYQLQTLSNVANLFGEITRLDFNNKVLVSFLITSSIFHSHCLGVFIRSFKLVFILIVCNWNHKNSSQ